GKAKLDGSSDLIAFPERHLSGLAWRGCDQYAVVSDLLDTPRRGAEDEGVANVCFEHHFLIQLADPRAAGCSAKEEDAKQPAVRNRAAVGDGDMFRSLSRDDRPVEAIPGDARTKLRKFVGGVPSREHVEHAV